MSVTRATSTAPREAARWDAATRGRRRRRACPGRGHGRSRSRPAAGPRPAGGRRAARRVVEHRDAVGGGQAEHAARAAADHRQRGRRTTASAAARPHGAGGRWHARTPGRAPPPSRAGPAPSRPRRTCAPAGPSGARTVRREVQPDHGAARLDEEAAPLELGAQDLAAEVVPDAERPRRVAGRHHRQAGVELALAVGPAEAPGVVAQHPVGAREGTEVMAPGGPAGVAGRCRRAGGGCSRDWTMVSTASRRLATFHRVAHDQRAPAWRHPRNGSRVLRSPKRPNIGGCRHPRVTSSLGAPSGDRLVTA